MEGRTLPHDVEHTANIRCPAGERRGQRGVAKLRRRALAFTFTFTPPPFRSLRPSVAVPRARQAHTGAVIVRPRQGWRGRGALSLEVRALSLSLSRRAPTPPCSRRSPPRGSRASCGPPCAARLPPCARRRGGTISTLGACLGLTADSTGCFWVCTLRLRPRKCQKRRAVWFVAHRLTGTTPPELGKNKPPSGVSASLPPSFPSLCPSPQPIYSRLLGSLGRCRYACILCARSVMAARTSLKCYWTRCWGPAVCHARTGQPLNAPYLGSIGRRGFLLRHSRRWTPASAD